MTEQFTRQQFEDSLPKKQHKVTKELSPMTEFVGAEKGELCWAMPIGQEQRIRILIRSSISEATGIADSSGENSIRLIVQILRADKWVAVSKGPDSYTKRIPGWNSRLRSKLKEMYTTWVKVKQDFTDDEVVFISRKPTSNGRVFAKKQNGNFRWLS